MFPTTTSQMTLENIVWCFLLIPSALNSEIHSAWRWKFHLALMAYCHHQTVSTMWRPYSPRTLKAILNYNIVSQCDEFNVKLCNVYNLYICTMCTKLSNVHNFFSTFGHHPVLPGNIFALCMQPLTTYLGASTHPIQRDLKRLRRAHKGHAHQAVGSIGVYQLSNATMLSFFLPWNPT